MNYLTIPTEEGIEMGRESLEAYDIIPEHNFVDNSKPDYFEGEPLTNFIDGIPIGNEIATTMVDTTPIDIDLGRVHSGRTLDLGKVL